MLAVWNLEILYDANAGGDSLKGADVDKRPAGMSGLYPSAETRSGSCSLSTEQTSTDGWDRRSGPEPLDYDTHGKFYVMDGPTWDGYYEFPPR
jgi:hypothetical protein